MTATVPNPVLTDRFVQAFSFASVVHSSQVRKGSAIPYVAHVIGVASLVLEHGGDEDTAIAALLHDAPEDQGGRAMLAQVRARFGERVAGIVEGCTDTFEQPKPEWRTRKTKYLAHLADARGGADVATCTVSAADKLHNARAILHDLRNGEAVFERFNSPQQQQGWYYGSLARVLHERLSGLDAMPLAVALRRTLEEISGERGAGSFAMGLQRGLQGEPCPE